MFDLWDLFSTENSEIFSFKLASISSCFFIWFIRSVFSKEILAIFSLWEKFSDLMVLSKSDKFLFSIFLINFLFYRL